MNRDEESWQKQLQHNRDEMRRLDNLSFWVSIIFAMGGISAVIFLLWMARNMAITTIIDGVAL